MTVTAVTGSVRELVDQRLIAVVEREMGRLGFLGEQEREAVRRLLARFVIDGGKRLRPSFVFWGHSAAEGSAEELDAVLSAGCAVELVHSCALILDDIMDESDTRRGRTTAHLALLDEHRQAGWRGDPRRYGESVATLLGLLAYTWADTAMVATGSARAWEVFTQLRVELIGGADLFLGKQTYLLAETRRRTGGHGHTPVDDVRDEAEVAAARELIVACGALEAVERRIDLLTRKATAALERARLPEEASAALAELARQVTDRRA